MARSRRILMERVRFSESRESRWVSGEGHASVVAGVEDTSAGYLLKVFFAQFSGSVRFREDHSPDIGTEVVHETDVEAGGSIFPGYRCESGFRVRDCRGSEAGIDGGELDHLADCARQFLVVHWFHGASPCGIEIAG